MEQFDFEECFSCGDLVKESEIGKRKGEMCLCNECLKDGQAFIPEKKPSLLDRFKLLSLKRSLGLKTKFIKIKLDKSIIPIAEKVIAKWKLEHSEESIDGLSIRDKISLFTMSVLMDCYEHLNLKEIENDMEENHK